MPGLRYSLITCRHSAICSRPIGAGDRALDRNGRNGGCAIEPDRKSDSPVLLVRAPWVEFRAP